MKSIEEKAKAYDEALARANEMIKSMTNIGGVAKVDDIQHIFPELKESEDELMIQYFKDLAPFDKADELYEKYGFSHKDAIAWLEKQCEQKIKTPEESLGIDSDTYNKIVDECIYGEQKPIDKVEPNFKVGDWVVYCNDDVDLITGIEENGYCINNSGYIPFICSSDIRLWTIQDAKDGDVLFTSSTASHETFIFKNIDEKGNAKCYFSYDSEDGFREGKYHFIGRATKCKPATKEQRDLLFQKMHEAGYEWDAEKKELIKIEQKPAVVIPKFRVGDTIKCKYDDRQFTIKSVDLDKGTYTYTQESCGNDIDYADEDFELVEQKPAWSEKDNEHVNSLLKRLDGLCRKEFTTTRFAINDDENWLESLKERYTWKPSEEQMNTLEYYMHTLVCNEHKEVLFGLYADLKKLMEK